MKNFVALSLFYLIFILASGPQSTNDRIMSTHSAKTEPVLTFPCYKCYSCFFCGHRLFDSSEPGFAPLIQSFVASCPEHRTILYHVPCLLECLTADNGPACKVCQFLSRVRGVSDVSSILYESLVDGILTAPENTLYRRMVSTVIDSGKSKKLWNVARRKCERKQFLFVSIYMSLRPEKQEELREIVNNTDDSEIMVNLSHGTGEFLRFLESSDSGTHKLAILSYKVNREFILSIPPEKIVLFAKQVFSIKSFRHHQFTQEKVRIITDFVQIAMKKVSTEELYDLLQVFVDIRTPSILTMVVKLYLMHRIELLPKRIFVLLFEKIAKASIHSGKKILFINTMLYFKCPLEIDPAQKDDLISYIIDRPNSVICRELAFYKNIFSEEEWRQLEEAKPVHRKTMRGISSLEWALAIPISHHPPFKSTQEYYDIISGAGFSVEALFVLFQTVLPEYKTVTEWEFLVESHPETDLFWEFSLMILKRSILLSQPNQVMKILGLLLRMRRLGQEDLCDLLSVLCHSEGNTHMSRTIGLITNRSDFGKFPDAILLRIFEMIRRYGNCGTRRRFLLEVLSRAEQLTAGCSFKEEAALK